MVTSGILLDRLPLRCCNFHHIRIGAYFSFKSWLRLSRKSPNRNFFHLLLDWGLLRRLNCAIYRTARHLDDNLLTLCLREMRVQVMINQRIIGKLGVQVRIVISCLHHFCLLQLSKLFIETVMILLALKIHLNSNDHTTATAKARCPLATICTILAGTTACTPRLTRC